MRDPPLIVIAAGGDGARIGGAKPARLVGGRRLVDHALGWARRHSDAVALAVRAGQDDWGSGLPLLADRQAGIGPIAALASAMRHADSLGREAVLLIGCDLPFLPDDLVERLAKALPGHAAALPSSSGRLHPMAALWRSDVAALDGWLALGGQSLWRFAEHAGMVAVAWDEPPDPLTPDLFANINDAAALAAAEARLRNGGR